MLEGRAAVEAPCQQAGENSSQKADAALVKVTCWGECECQFSTLHPVGHRKDVASSHGLYIMFRRLSAAHFVGWWQIVFFLILQVHHLLWQTDWCCVLKDLEKPNERKEVWDKVIFPWWIRAGHSFVPWRILWSAFIPQLSLMGSKLSCCQVTRSRDNACTLSSLPTCSRFNDHLSSSDS